MYQGLKIEGLLMNVRAVQAIFDDLNPETRNKWAYPDTGKWDPERNTREFIAALPEWRRNGLLAFTVNLQGGSPEGYSKSQPWENTAIDPDGNLRPAYMNRLGRVLDRADELGMVAIVGYFYFGQDQRVKDEAAVRRAVTNATNWLLDGGYRNVLVEVDNECDVKAYDHEILKPARVHELIELVKGMRRGRTAYAGRHQLRRRLAGHRERRQGVRFPAAARQRGGRSGASPQDDPGVAPDRNLAPHACAGQRRRPLPLQRAG